MSEEKTVETTTGEPGQVADEQVEAIWSDLAKEEAQAAGTADDLGDEGKKDETGTGQADTGTPSGEDEGKPPASTETTDDLWKDAPAALREAYEAERARAEAAESVAKSHGGRLSQAYRDLEAARAQLSKETDGATEGKKTLSDEEKAALREEYPDSVGKVLDIVDGLEGQIKTLTEATAAQASQRTETVLAEQTSLMDERHPDWDQVVRSEDYLAWVEKQPGYVIETLQRNAERIVDGVSCADILDRFKAETQKPDPEKERHQERREEQMDALKGVDGKRPTTASKGSDDPEAIWKELQEQDRRAAAVSRAYR